MKYFLDTSAGVLYELSQPIVKKVPGGWRLTGGLSMVHRSNPYDDLKHQLTKSEYKAVQCSLEDHYNETEAIHEYYSRNAPCENEVSHEEFLRFSKLWERKKGSAKPT